MIRKVFPAFVLVLTAVGGLGRTGEARAEPPPPAGPPGADLAPLSLRNVTIYYPSGRENSLTGLRTEIFDTASPVERVKQIVADLIAGPSVSGAMPAVPKGTRLRQAYVLDSRVAYVDFSSELRDNMRGGTSDEILTVYSIVNSVVLNVPEVDRVGILVDGQPCKTLGGHLSLSRPLPPRRDLIRNVRAGPG